MKKGLSMDVRIPMGPQLARTLPHRPESPLNLFSLRKPPELVMQEKRQKVYFCKLTTSIVFTGVSLFTISLSAALFYVYHIPYETIPAELAVFSAVSLIVPVVCFSRMPFVQEIYNFEDAIPKELLPKYNRLKELNESDFEKNKALFLERTLFHNQEISQTELETLAQWGALQLENFNELELFFQKRSLETIGVRKSVHLGQERLQQKYLQIKRISSLDVLLQFSLKTIKEYLSLKENKQLKFFHFLHTNPYQIAIQNINQCGYFAFIYDHYIHNSQEKINELTEKIGIPPEKHILCARKMYNY